MRVLLDKLEEKMKDTEVEGTIGSLFAGMFISTFILWKHGCSYYYCYQCIYSQILKCFHWHDSSEFSFGFTAILRLIIYKYMYLLQMYVFHIFLPKFMSSLKFMNNGVYCLDLTIPYTNFALNLLENCFVI